MLRCEERRYNGDHRREKRRTLMSEPEFMINKFKLVSVERIEKALAKAVGELVGEECEAQISSVEFLYSLGSHRAALHAELSYPKFRRTLVD